MHLKLLLCAVMAATMSCNAQNSKKMEYNKLTPQEERVLLHKATDMPFTGAYYKKTDAGTYLCRRCNAPLYKSQDKFDSSCGWPSFDDEIKGAVKRVLMLMVCVLKLFVPTVVAILVMFLQVKD